jgi:hypothetical protein
MVINVGIFKIVGNNMSKTSQNIKFTLGTTIFMAKHGVEVRLEKIVVKDDPSMSHPNHNRSLIDLCNY